MKKRRFLQAVLAGGTVALVSSRLLKTDKSDYIGSAESSLNSSNSSRIITPSSGIVTPRPVLSAEDAKALELVVVEESVHEDVFKHSEREPDVSQLEDEQVNSYLAKIRNFDADYDNDIYLSESNSQILLTTLERMKRVERYVGHGNYNLLGFDEMLFFARNYEEIGPFEKVELDFLEEIFFADANNYGFFGEKVTAEMTHRIDHKDVVKISGSGHYLLNGESYKHYEHIRKDVGKKLLLTSGIRNVVKQIHLFLAKTIQSNNNLSKASRSLAPPGHSFHGIGDFDVGKIGLGKLNFTASFSNTEEFSRMIRLGYIDIRYTDRNEFGVRYEPWHIKIS